VSNNTGINGIVTNINTVKNNSAATFRKNISLFTIISEVFYNIIIFFLNLLLYNKNYLTPFVHNLIL